MPVPNIVAADSKTLDEADETQLGDGGPSANAWRDRGAALRPKAMRRDNTLVRMSTVSQ